MAGSPEIVTIQAGSYANFIGTHWWNMQESSFCYDPSSALPLDINHDILFREGVNYKGETTFTPRLVLIDLKENLKSIRKECPLYRLPDEENHPLWDGAVDVIRQFPNRRNPFLDPQPSDSCPKSESADSGGNIDPSLLGSNDFNDSTTVWCDFLKTNLHPRSFCLLHEVSSNDRNPLETYSSGDEIYRKDGREIIEESVRRMTEECDNLQGFQLIYDSHNGFSGIVNHLQQHLDDEYCRRASVCFPTFQSNKHAPYQDTKEQMHRLYAILLSLSSLISYSSLFSPLALCSDVVKFNEPFRRFPFLQYDANIQYQTSSILAAAIETLSSQYRLRSMKFSLSDVTSAMAMYGRKLVCSSLCLPFPLSEDAFLSNMVEKDNSEYYMTSLSPFYDPSSEKTLYQSAVLRGIPKAKFSKPSKSYHAVEPEQIFGEYLNKYSSSSVTTATVFGEMCSVTFPFPRIFKNTVGTNGFLQSDVYLNDEGLPAAKRFKPQSNRSRKLSCYNYGTQGVDKVPVAASFSSSDSAARYIDSLLNEASKHSFKEFVKCAESSFEKDDFVEVMQNVIGLRDNYEDY